MTDEALVTWFLKCYIADWEKIHEDRQEQVHGQGNVNRQRRKEGKHKSKEELGVYLDLHASIKQARNEKGNGWDEAVMEEAKLQDDRIHNMVEPTDSMQNAPLANGTHKRTYVMMFSDDEEEDEEDSITVQEV